MGNRKKILIVDDDDLMREMYIERLMLEDYDISSAVDGQDAYPRLAEINPDMILLDLKMPRMNGFEFLEKIKSEERFKRIPVIVFTAMIQEGDRTRSMTLGAEDYILKSVSMPTEVVAKVKSTLSKAR